jgi:hypothetical protein
VKPFFVHPGDLIFNQVANPSFVVPGLVPGIHVLSFSPPQRTRVAQELVSRVPSLIYFAQVG